MYSKKLFLVKNAIQHNLRALPPDFFTTPITPIKKNCQKTARAPLLEVSTTVHLCFQALKNDQFQLTKFQLILMKGHSLPNSKDPAFLSQDGDVVELTKIPNETPNPVKEKPDLLN